MGTMDLSFLTDQERMTITKVLARDEEMCIKDQLLFDNFKTDISQIETKVKQEQATLKNNCEIHYETVLNTKYKQLFQMSGAWVFYYARDKDGDMTPREYENKMSLPFDGINGLSGSEVIKQCFFMQGKSLKHTEVENAPIQEGKDYEVFAKVYSFDDLSQSTKEKHLMEVGQGENLDAQSEVSNTTVESVHDKDTVDAVTDVQECPVHPPLEKTPMAKLNDHDYFIISNSHDERNSEDSKVNTLTNKNVSSNSSMISQSSDNLEIKKEKLMYHPYNRQDEGFEDMSFTSSLDLSLHGSYINSYYGD